VSCGATRPSHRQLKCVISSSLQGRTWTEALTQGASSFIRGGSGRASTPVGGIWFQRSTSTARQTMPSQMSPNRAFQIRQLEPIFSLCMFGNRTFNRPCNRQHRGLGVQYRRCSPKPADVTDGPRDSPLASQGAKPIRIELCTVALS
jgi:hypothetical protein